MLLRARSWAAAGGRGQRRAHSWRPVPCLLCPAQSQCDCCGGSTQEGCGDGGSKGPRAAGSLCWRERGLGGCVGLKLSLHTHSNGAAGQSPGADWRPQNGGGSEGPLAKASRERTRAARAWRGLHACGLKHQHNRLRGSRERGKQAGRRVPAAHWFYPLVFDPPKALKTGDSGKTGGAPARKDQTNNRPTGPAAAVPGRAAAAAPGESAQVLTAAPRRRRQRQPGAPQNRPGTEAGAAGAHGRAAAAAVAPRPTGSSRSAARTSSDVAPIATHTPHCVPLRGTVLKARPPSSTIATCQGLLWFGLGLAAAESFVSQRVLRMRAPLRPRVQAAQGPCLCKPSASQTPPGAPPPPPG